MERLEILPMLGIGDIVPGTDLAAVIAAAAPRLGDGDVLVVTSKIVSKAEGQLVEIPPAGPEREAARAEVLRSQTARMVARRGPTQIVATHHGFVMAAAGVDNSNVDSNRLVLLPKDPDASARALRTALRERYGLDVAVIISDTMGRPWRIGLTDVALGAAGIQPIRDYRGETDPYGNELMITQMAVVDELAAAAELVKGKLDQVPIAVVRGYGRTGGAAPPGPGVAADGPGVAMLIRTAAEDMFSLGTAEAMAAGLASAARLGDAEAFGNAPVDPAVVVGTIEALPVASNSLFEIVEPRAPVPPGTAVAVACRVVSPGDPGQLVALGCDVHRLRCALAAEGLASTWVDSTWVDSTWVDSAGPDLVGLLAIGPAKPPVSPS